TVNDSLGHNAGDELLVAVARRLQSILRPSDTAARLGGDEFAILVGDLHDQEEAADVARRVLETLSEPALVSDKYFVIQGRVGSARAMPPARSRPARSRRVHPVRRRERAHHRARRMGAATSLRASARVARRLSGTGPHSRRQPLGATTR